MSLKAAIVILVVLLVTLSLSSGEWLVIVMEKMLFMESPNFVAYLGGNHIFLSLI